MHQRFFYILLAIIPVFSFAQTKNGDVNGDGVVDAADIVEIVNIIMHPEEGMGNNEKKYSLRLMSDACVYSNSSHAAFTSLIDYRGDKLLAFREGSSHRPTGTNDYGHIKVLKEMDGQWFSIADLSHHDMDLRDPFFVNVNGGLRIYCGYNQFVDEKYQHSGTVYSDLKESGWSQFTPIKHDVPHITWLWKIRRYNDLLYGVGYLEGERPVLLCSPDGIDWTTVTTFNLDGVLSEADLCFSEDSMYVCLRQDSPVGSKSHWGKSKYPFMDFDWKMMNISVASPELFVHPLSSQILLAGREYDFRNDNKPDSINVSLFCIDTNAMAERLYVFDTAADGDKGYPSFLYQNDMLYLSYYYGYNSTQVHVAEIGIVREDE